MTKRNFARGTPPPRGSIEWVAVGDMWDPAPPSANGFDLYDVSYTDLDAAERWVAAVDRSVRQARSVHGDRILSKDDEAEWDDFAKRWRKFDSDLKESPSWSTLPLHLRMMQESSKRDLDRLLDESRKLHDRFAKKGMSPSPVPYAGELLQLLRQTPKKLTAAEMRAKLLAGAKCGDRMLDENTSWYSWAVSSDHVPLRRAVGEARALADVYGLSSSSKRAYSPGDPSYDEFMRRLARIWIEAAGLYGIREVRQTARAGLRDDLRKAPERGGGYALWLLAAAGAAYLGISWLARPRSTTVVIGVPDAYPQKE